MPGERHQTPPRRLWRYIPGSLPSWVPVMRLSSRLAPALAGAFVAFPLLLLAQDRSQSRSTVSTTLGVVATESVLASQVAARVLEAGGNAIDAAIAANAMMGLVAPMNDGIGGDLFAIVYEAKTGKLHGLNASGWAPRGLTPAGNSNSPNLKRR